MTEVDHDLVECAREPIHVPGSVQPWGVLLGLDADHVVVRCSANAGDLLGVDPLGSSIGDVVDGWDASAASADDLGSVNPLALAVGGRRLDAALSRSGGLLLVELEPAADADQASASFHRTRHALNRLQAAATLEELAAVTCREVREVTGFDRVMVYRFTPEWDGEVLAEDRRDDLEPFIGLRYPASDIPAQARELYRTQWMRLIADVDATPSPLLPHATGLDGEPLDLGGAVLRSVSPVHLEYLRNMGVSASMSISLIDRGQLWGLVACHGDRGPHRPSFPVRAAAELLGRTMSLLLPTTTSAGEYERAMAVRDAEGRILARLADPEVDVVAAAVAGPEVLDVVGATGAVLQVDGRQSVVGDVPAGLDAAPLARRLLARAEVGWSHEVDGAPAEAAGALVARIGTEADQWVLWVRPEVVRTVSWGGDPREKVERFGGRLSPRRSFAIWQETVRGRSERWTADDAEAAKRLATTLAASLLRRSRARAEVADTVQRAILLESLPEIPGARIAARYQPTADDAVGGDWYDLFWLPDGRVAIAVGDVAGHGVQVAPVMAQLRHALRAYLLQERSPAGALVRLNELASHLLPTDLASVVVADLDPSTSWRR